MTRSQRFAEQRFYDICGWEWNENLQEYEIHVIECDLTIEEAKEAFSDLIPDEWTPQYDLFFDDEDVREKVACREALVDGTYEEWM